MFVYQAYGHQAIFDECRYSLLSLCHWAKLSNKRYGVWIYTDHPELFEEFQRLTEIELSTILLTQETIRNWKGEVDFVHRLKIELLIDLFSKTTGPVIYLDTDTFFIAPPEDLFLSIGQKQHLMHTREGQIQKRSNPVLRKLDKFIKREPSLAELIPLYSKQGIDMWNAGVLGLQSPVDLDLLLKVRQLTDQIYPLYPKHVIEQFAFSYVLQSAGPIEAAEGVVHHYWNFKEFRGLLAQFFAKYPELADQQKHWQRLDLRALEKPKRAYEALSGWKRAIRKLTGSRWQMPDHRF